MCAFFSFVFAVVNFFFIFLLFIFHFHCFYVLFIYFRSMFCWVACSVGDFERLIFFLPLFWTGFAIRYSVQCYISSWWIIILFLWFPWESRKSLFLYRKLNVFVNIFILFRVIIMHCRYTKMIFELFLTREKRSAWTATSCTQFRAWNTKSQSSRFFKTTIASRGSMRFKEL